MLLNILPNLNLKLCFNYVIHLHMFSYVCRKEISRILKSSYLRGLNMASFFASSKLIIFVTFTVYTLLGNTMTASQVFVTMSLYGTIKVTLTLFFPLAIEKLSETVVSIRRIKVINFCHKLQEKLAIQQSCPRQSNNFQSWCKTMFIIFPEFSPTGRD